MAKIILIVGGSRSGKSEYARARAESLPGPRMFLATCPPLDEEMRARIAAHHRARAECGWETVEEYGDIICALRSGANKYNVALVDCLTLWLNNLMREADARGEKITEKDISSRCRDIVEVCAKMSGYIFFVANEVGMGIVPDNPASRRFRDLAGRCNQSLAASADEVILVSCGIPLHLKGGANDPD
ncbi:MAG: bifunctional adenosylcobinamide kinase/adenosylcobinamide-phosphate guanylyltransferase [Candidatus Abyssobacteria bacterium SURF_5]|uniref:Adenosylcobinamide kinase n=1 Tax=Abyssobacteria bacterium (strain SURF_5) TaxID=2093360 RepID=A0A3A4NFL8_ABYX5|nr:MAG: bifunctional adenosylcobinamide kinase/adenosylcobinamide-phosphate guanylyltransferase [Candidatus Abyssubacteria bacterium SURF_5]